MTHNTKERARNMAAELGVAFVWEDTEEGHKYWEEVHSKLHAIANPPPPPPLPEPAPFTVHLPYERYAHLTSLESAALDLLAKWDAGGLESCHAAWNQLTKVLAE